MSRVNPVGGDLAGRWLSRFLTNYLAGERDLSAQTIASYRDAIRLLLTWFRDVGETRPEKLRLADLDRARVLSFLDWLEAARDNSAATRNQRLAVIKSFVRYTAVERPEFLEQATQILAVKQKKTPASDLGHLTGSEIKALLAEPDAATRRGLRDTVLLSMLYDTAARVQEICNLNTSDIRAARPMVVSLRGKGCKTRRVPLMDPTAHLVEDYLKRRAPHLGVGADADPLFSGPEQTRLTRWGVTKILARHVQSLRRREPDYAAGMNVTPHMIRRTRAMHLLEAGVNLIYIRDLLGHADVSTTEIYARADAEAKRKAIESAYQSLTPSVCLTGQQTKISSHGLTTPVGNTQVMWPEQARTREGRADVQDGAGAVPGRGPRRGEQPSRALRGRLAGMQEALMIHRRDAFIGRATAH